MAFNGKLIELKTNGSWVNFPIKYIKAESYKVTPDQRMESEANRSADGYLKRTTVDHTASKIDFTTTNLTNTDVKRINDMRTAAFTNAKQRKVDVRYYNPDTDSYNTGTFYMPDVDYEINRVDLQTNTVHYNPIRFAFIEY